MNTEEVTLYTESMTTEEAIGEVENALSNYRNQSLSSKNEEGDLALLDKAWDIITSKVSETPMVQGKFDRGSYRVF
jgi:hypothetical protein